MSWLSSTLDKTRKTIDRTAVVTGKALPKSWRPLYRKVFNQTAATVGGGGTMQYEYSRNKGMSSDEATKNSLTGGLQYSEARGMQKARVAEDASDAANADLERKRVAEEARARGQIAARVRRGMRDRPSTKSGTILTGGLGTTGSGAGQFAALLGLV